MGETGLYCEASFSFSFRPVSVIELADHKTVSFFLFLEILVRIFHSTWFIFFSQARQLCCNLGECAFRFCFGAQTRSVLFPFEVWVTLFFVVIVEEISVRSTDDPGGKEGRMGEREDRREGGRKEGRKEGRAEGRKEGGMGERKDGRVGGRKEGRKDGRGREERRGSEEGTEGGRKERKGEEVRKERREGRKEGRRKKEIRKDGRGRKEGKEVRKEGEWP